MKRCASCRQRKTSDEFGSDRSKRDGRNIYCKMCVRERHARHMREKPDEVRAAARERTARYRERNPERYRRTQLAQYGLTPDEYDEMLSSQAGVCAICGSSESRAGVSALSVDHCHETGIVRGLLCNRCNVGIGRFGDDPALLRQALEYLTSRQARR